MKKMILGSSAQNSAPNVDDFFSQMSPPLNFPSNIALGGFFLYKCTW